MPGTLTILCTWWLSLFFWFPVICVLTVNHKHSINALNVFKWHAVVNFEYTQHLFFFLNFKMITMYLTTCFEVETLLWNCLLVLYKVKPYIPLASKHETWVMSIAKFSWYSFQPNMLRIQVEYCCLTFKDRMKAYFCYCYTLL